MTDLRKALARNTLWLLSGQAISRALKFAVVAYAARQLGVEAIGSLAYATALTTLSFTFSDVGLSTLLVREYQQAATPRRLVVKLAKLKGLLVGLSAIATCAAFFAVGGVAGPLLLLVLATTVLDTARDFVTAIARAKEKGHLEALILVAEGILTVLLGVALLAGHGTVFALAGGYALAAFLTLLVALAMFFPEFRSGEEGEEVRVRDLAKNLWPFAAAAAIAVVFTQVDTALLGKLNGPEDAGLYGAGSRIMQILLMLPALVGVAVLPTLTKMRGEPGGQARVTRGALSGALLLAVPLAAGGALLASDVLALVYGPAFAAGGPAFALLLFSFLLFAVTTILDHLLLSLNLQGKNFAYTSAAAAANVALSLLLIPRYGPAGAGLSALLAQALNLALTLRLARRKVGQPLLDLADLSRYVAAAAAMAAVVAAVQVDTPSRIALGVLAYGAGLAILRPRFLRGWLAAA